jgi:hypothetical protein
MHIFLDGVLRIWFGIDKQLQSLEPVVLGSIVFSLLPLPV